MRITALFFTVALAAAAPVPVLVVPDLPGIDGVVRTNPGNELTHPIRIDPPLSGPEIIACDPLSPKASCVEVPLPAPGKPSRPGPGPIVKKCKFLFPGSRCILIPETDHNATHAHPEPSYRPVIATPGPDYSPLPKSVNTETAA